MNRCERVFVIGAALSMQWMAAAQAQKAPEPPKPVVIKAATKHEKCLNLDAGQKLIYQFEAGAKVNFTLSFKKSADETYYPVKLDRTQSEGGVYEAKSRNRYCLAWDNRTDKDVELTYSARTGR
jgi:hypothetical protein